VKTRSAKPSVAIDFDGVVHRYGRGWQDGTIYDEPMPGAIDGLKRLQERYALIVFTSRRPADVFAWLTRYGVRCYLDPAAIPGSAEDPPEFWGRDDLLLVTNRKLPAIAYLDDRAVRFVDWASVDAQIEAMS
jgi:phosphoglycolate phosphatase-like HAD superfamily hydrolase